MSHRRHRSKEQEKLRIKLKRQSKFAKKKRKLLRQQQTKIVAKHKEISTDAKKE
jgi:hypothetical protein